MITPTLLLSACGTFVVSTSIRLGRVIDRIRALSDKMEDLIHGDRDVEMVEERRAMILEQLQRLSSRASMLQRTLSNIYIASGLFVLTSVALGLVAVIASSFTWVPVVLGITGVVFLLYACLLLVFEIRLSRSTLQHEIDYTLRIIRDHVRPEKT